MIWFTGTVLGEVVLDRALSRIISNSKDFTGPFAEAGKEIRAIIKEVFNTEGFGEWPELSPAYAERKRQLYGDRPLLRASDALYESFIVEGAYGNITRIFPMYSEFGSGIAYGIYHQTGTDRMPSRPELIFREEDKQQLVRVMQRYMIATGQSAGFQVIAA